MKTHTLGLTSVSFRPLSPRAVVEAAKQAGLDCIEWGSDVHAPCADADVLREIVGLQREYGIFCSSYGTYFRLGVTPLAELTAYMDAAKQLGTRVLRVWCGSKSGDRMSAEERASLVQCCREAAAMAKQYDVVLCLECHRDTFTENVDDALFLMREIDSPHFRMYWQPFQWQSHEENCWYAQTIAPYTENIHVFYWRESARYPLSQAASEWRAYLSCFTRSHTLLLEFMPNDDVAELPEEAAALKAIVGETV